MRLVLLALVCLACRPVTPEPVLPARVQYQALHDALLRARGF